MRIQKFFLFVLFTAVVAGLVLAQAPPKDPKDKLFGKVGREDDPNGRTLQGAVTNEDGALLEGAVVTLKNLKSSNERSFITKKEGTYRFDSLLKDVDYDMKASFK